jgi:isocitrate/isopropylmalate dehydrogenase
MYLTPTAPHFPTPPAPRHEPNPFGAYEVPEGVNFNEADVSDKPTWLRDGVPALDAAGLESMTTPDVTWDKMLVDAMTMRMVGRPETLDTIVATNLHADILSDLAAALAGSLGIAPTANINPERAHPSMFEPVHGSAPDIAGQHVCNPIGQVWSGAMMLEHLGETDAAAAIVSAIETLRRDGGPRTRDMGGQAGTAEVGRALAEIIGTG